MRKINTDDYDDNTLLSTKDIIDIDILITQSNAQLVLALGYLLEYKASMQALELIQLRYLYKLYNINLDDNNEDAESIGENEDEELEEQYWKSAGVDSDKTALLAAVVELYAQTILTRLDFIKLQYLNQNFEEKDFEIVKTANDEIFIGALLEEIAYIFNYEGAKKLYNVSNENPVSD